MSFLKKLLIANISISLIVIAFIIFTIFKFNNFLKTKPSQTHKPIYLEIHKNQPVKSIIKELKSNGLLIRSDWFYYYLRLTGRARNIKAGVHLFYTDYTPKQILKELTNPELYTKKITIPEGLTLRKIASILNKNDFDGSKLLELSDNESFIKKCIDFPAKTLEGFFYPDTYYIAIKEKTETIALLACRRFRDVLKDISHKNKVEKSDYDKLIIASIIQKEATTTKDMQLVAGVIYNRLKKHMPLQMDSTTNLSNPFNTYKHVGLPVAPICNPGRDALFAAYNPKPTNYLYFISKKNGEMVFSKTLKEHNKNIRKYLR
ncbi:endolytic transglycosylase MltG [Hippea maritima]|uniref:Endolytic murein transglycosylase n=1 Tax=Hippea maritima (strain ATCC 700847 / DSM 10411 / MH2) TaxID=760142 RepID=F2LWN2_HIPMA|nr:endolytic transglycosylase MltG [Hippea maritima]AEA33010.1 aminodeoxychorismate lyase [Hippea maritima DSM 10411]